MKKAGCKSFPWQIKNIANSPLIKLPVEGEVCSTCSKETAVFQNPKKNRTTKEIDDIPYVWQLQINCRRAEKTTVTVI